MVYRRPINSIIAIFIFLFSFNVYALDNLKVLIPLYSVPSLWIEQIEKLKSIKDKEITTYAIINPNNGPGEKEQQDYIDGIKLLKEHNIHVIGYVYTLYGKRDPNIVKEDIYKWSSFYQEYGLEGIFFDETDNKVDSLEFYKDWLEVADDEIRHFLMLEELLGELDAKYGDFDVHKNLPRLHHHVITALKYRDYL